MVRNFSGGNGGTSYQNNGNIGSPGILGVGGDGAVDPCFNIGPGGGGGGGYYGGGGGGSDCINLSFIYGGSGGAGGSSLTPATFNCIQGNNNGNGYITINYELGRNLWD